MKLKRIFTVMLLLIVLDGRLDAQVLASFSFSQNSTAGYGWSDAGWTNVFGDPFTGVRTATANGITISSISTSNWVTNNGACAEDAVGATGGTFFPDHILRCHWYQASSSGGAAYNASVPQFRISGLNKDSFYILRMSSSYAFGAFGDPTQYTVAGLTTAPSQFQYSNNNTATGVTFQHIYPDANGRINVYVNTTTGKNVAYISGIQIISGSSTVGIPVVSITSPAKNEAVIKGSNIAINATATETGSTISKVEFFADGTKLGESTTSPYAYTWQNPAEGAHVIVAKATDPAGTTASDTANITIVSLSSFWSLKGNSNAKGDSNFVGTLDTNRLAFRTNNKERMNLSKNGAFTVIGAKPDSIRKPSFKVYENGDFTASSTMDTSVNTDLNKGVRFNSRANILQIGTSDRISANLNDTAYAIYPTSAVIVNTDWPNIIKGRLMNTLMLATLTNFDSAWRSEGAVIAGESLHFDNGPGPDLSLIRSFVGGYDSHYSGTMDCEITNGAGHYIPKPLGYGIMTGYQNYGADTAYTCLIAGENNQFGGLVQFVMGSHLTNSTPFGTALGRSNVDFGMPYTGLRGVAVPNIEKYPLFSLGNSTSGNLSIHSNALTILNNGRTQINTTGVTNNLNATDATPKAALDVVSTNTGVLLPRLTNTQRGAIAAGDLQNGLLLYNTDSSAFQYYNGTAWNSLAGGTGSGSGRWLFNNGVQYDSLNTVAIGTSSTPSGYKLAVKGSALFTRVQVMAAGSWPDYVFAKGYRLRSLEDLESYIRKYKHLPEIASAAKVDKEGINMAAAQSSILKKVEELTLYLIEENKQLKAQNDRLSDQSRQIAEQKALFEKQQREIDELKALLKKK
ncbi:MAG: hypothetical protein JST68_20530 [Bacteroidetes bacterium]|nr:hypothetical protein [Bacteroidota bacterium]